MERAGGRLGIFKQVAEIAVQAGYCFSIADADGVLVRREGKIAQQSEYDSNGISLGSCWDERIAGTNGVSMTIAQQRAFTVRGQEHYFSKLRPFACTGVPLRDAENQMIGVLNLATVDRGNAADYAFAKQLLGTAAERIQRILFERQFCEAMLVSVSLPATGELLRNSELVAVDHSGQIVGSTLSVHEMIGLGAPMDLVGRPFEDVFGADALALDRTPEHAPVVRTGDGQIVRLSRHLTDRKQSPGRGWSQAKEMTRARSERHPSLSVQDLAAGCPAIAEQVKRARTYLDHAIPFVVQGASGTGKTALLSALHASAEVAKDEILTIDCAGLGDGDNDKAYIHAIFEQARIVNLLGRTDRDHLTLVLDNVDELPKFAQAVLRNLLQDGEGTSDAVLGTNGTGVAVIATTRKPLSHVVQAGAFRDDLYYLLANAIIVLPPVRERGGFDMLVQTLAARLASRPVDITPDAMKALASYPWPGNVRELKSVLRQALLEGNGRRISLMDLRSTPLFEPMARRPVISGSVDSRNDADAYREEDRIIDALISARWNVSLAARKLGIGRATINRKMKQFGISRPS